MDTVSKLASGPVRFVRDAARRHLRSTDATERIRHRSCPDNRGTAVRTAALYCLAGSCALATTAAAGRATGPGRPHLPAAGGPALGVAGYGGVLRRLDPDPQAGQDFVGSVLPCRGKHACGTARARDGR